MRRLDRAVGFVTESDIFNGSCMFLVGLDLFSFSITSLLQQNTRPMTPHKNKFEK